MKKVACAVLVLIMVIFLINPLSIAAGGGYGGGGHGSGGYGSGGHWGGGYGRGGYWGGGYWRGGYWGWWAPWAVIGGAAALAPYYYPYYYPYYDSYYNSPYYAPPPAVVREQSPVYVQPAPSSNGRIFVYPRNGQSEKLQAKDRYECHSWAVSQTHYDPTQLTGGMSEAQLNQMRSDYKRAMGACLDGRGYSMR
ncbi:MAG: hypothetical protein ABSF79_01300 [Smithellaceae bacterium]